MLRRICDLWSPGGEATPLCRATAAAPGLLRRQEGQGEAGPRNLQFPREGTAGQMGEVQKARDCVI